MKECKQCCDKPPALRKFHEAKERNTEGVVVWGTGTPLREFLHVDDLARGILFCLDYYDDYEHINCGAGSEICIGDLAHLIAEIVGYGGKIIFDTSKPDGAPRKLMDSSRIAALGWRPEISLKAGIASACDWYCRNVVGA